MHTGKMHRQCYKLGETTSVRQYAGILHTSMSLKYSTQLTAKPKTAKCLRRDILFREMFTNERLPKIINLCAIMGHVGAPGDIMVHSVFITAAKMCANCDLHGRSASVPP
ncbi:hypothetical protein CRM22_010864 [Opisthorchis felineus]|uniref:Uncharacterized protein n=1 Tax=Opisthorchis felineus TaxID=147828 RepID=A0A4V3SAV1_OPIFE|nr:hypothetical protein CRM22_010864 [Opisthorchis felineus]